MFIRVNSSKTKTIGLNITEILTLIQAIDNRITHLEVTNFHEACDREIDILEGIKDKLRYFDK